MLASIHASDDLSTRRLVEPVPPSHLQLGEWFKLGSAKFPRVEFSLERFALALGAYPVRRAPEEPADLFVSRAYVDGAVYAAEAIEVILKGPVKRAIAGMVGSEAGIADALQELWITLLLPTPGAPPKVSSFGGESKLSTWMITSAIRMVQRKGQRDQRTAGDFAAAATLPDRALMPDVELAKRRYRAEVSRALTASVSGLSSRDRALLRLHFVEGVRLETLAVIYGVSRATVARWIATAKGRIFDAVRKDVAARFGLHTTEFDSVVRLVQSNLEVNLASALLLSARNEVLP